MKTKIISNAKIVAWGWIALRGAKKLGLFGWSDYSGQ